MNSMGIARVIVGLSEITGILTQAPHPHKQTSMSLEFGFTV